MVIYLVSGNGQGSGKTTLAKRLVGNAVFSIAAAIRRELKSIYPMYEWHNTSQAYKDGTKVREYEDGSYTIRDVMVEYGQDKCKNDSAYWVKKLIVSLNEMVGYSVIAIDDVRKTVELDYLKTAFPNSYHFHIIYPKAVQEPQYDNDQLKLMADYRVTRD